MNFKPGFAILALGLAAWLGPVSGLAAKYSPSKATFSVRCHELVSGYDLQTVFAMPGEALKVEALDANWHSVFNLESEAGQIQQAGDRQWSWTPPAEPGLYQARLEQSATGRTLVLQAWVMVPFDQVRDGYINGYRIGTYPPEKEIQSVRYRPPQGLVEVTATAMDVFLSPHFTVGQFVCRQASDFPKYLVLDERLVIKLEALLERVNAQGYRCRTLGINCAYRTPAYNEQQGYSAYSAHQWGQAADIYVDTDGTGLMGDLNHDGKRDEQDSQIIGHIVENMDGTPRHQDLIGGLGLYDGRRGHGAFVHVDVRGAPARWEVHRTPGRKKN